MPDWTPTKKSTDEEIETDRRRCLADAFDDRQDRFPDEKALVDDFGPGTYGAHEALHGASIVLDQFGRHVLEHPTILGDPQAYRLAWRAHEYLFDLYQYLGAVHIPAMPEVAPTRTDAD